VEEIDGKIRMKNHEKMSSIMILSFIKKYKKELSEYYSRQNLIDILYAINYHGALWQKSEKQILKYFSEDEKLFNIIKEFSKYDYAGNISISPYKGCKITSDDFVIDYEYDKNKPTIYMMVGLPGSGKDTYISSELSDLEVLSRDDILMEFGKNKFGDLSYNELWSKLTKEDQDEISKLLQKRFIELKRNGKDFVINMTNLSWKSRRQWFSNKHNINICLFLEPLETIYERNKLREGKEISEEVILSMVKRFELPLYGEHKNISEIKIISSVI
jgi:predicted kinase